MGTWMCGRGECRKGSRQWLYHCWALPHPRATPLVPFFESAPFDRSCCFEIFPLAFSSSPLITHSRNLMPPVKASEPSARHHRPPPPLLTLSLTYMVKSPAALVPCCKTILPLWEAVEFPLLMVQMAPACKPLTEMFLDSVSAGGRGRGRGWSEGWSLQAVISIPCLYRIAHTSQGSAAASSASLTLLVAAFLWPKGLVLWGQRVQDLCISSRGKLAVYTSPGLFPGRICQAWLVFTLAIWSFICQPHTCCSFHPNCWALVIFLVNHCYLLGLVGFPS